MKAMKIVVDVLIGTGESLGEMFQDMRKDSHSAARKVNQLFYWISGEVQAALAIFVLVLVLMLPFPISIARHYRHLAPAEKYWFSTYLRTEFSPWSGGIYRLLVVEDSNNNQQLVSSENVLPGETTTAEGDTFPFVLAPKDQQEGKKLALLPSRIEDNDKLWSTLSEKVYHRQSISEMGASGFWLGFWLNMVVFGVMSVIVVSKLVLDICNWIFRASHFVVRRVKRSDTKARSELVDEM